MTAEKKDAKAVAEAPAKKAPAKKTVAKKAAPKKEPAKKPAVKKAPAKKAASKKTAAPKKTAAKAPAKKAAPKETAAKTPAKKAEPKKAAAKASKSTKILKITQVKSQIGFAKKQRRVLAGLGLGRIGRTVTRGDDPCIRGMVAKVIHLVSVEELEG